MREFEKVNKVFIKSNNTVNKIFNRYLFSLIPYIILIIIYSFIWGSVLEIVNIIKSISISLIISVIVQYIFNLSKKEKDITKIFLDDCILTISIILGLFSMNSSILVIVMSSVITVVMKNFIKYINISSSLYGILFILVSNYYLNDIDTPLYNLSNLSYIGTFSNIVKPYGGILNYSLGLTTGYLSPILSILVFIYLFYKKSIKYNIIFSYILTFLFIMFSFGIMNDMSIWYLFFQLTTGSILFLAVFCLTDYPCTPTTGEGQIIYGIILGLITSILRFIIPELSVVISLILGPLLLTKFINKISFKLKYNKKYYCMMMVVCFVLTVVISIMLNIII